jgi:hypothetical protein
MQASRAHGNQRLTPRDYAILQDIGRCGALTAEQIGVHHFGWAVVRKGARSNPEAVPQLAIFANCQRRMKFLHDSRLVKRVERFQLLRDGKQPYLYTLTLRGAQVLATYQECEVGEVEWRQTDPRLRPNYIEHLILTNDVRLGVERAARVSPYVALVAWHDELTLGEIHRNDQIPLALDEGKHQYVKLVPDAYFVLRTRDSTLLHHFVEIDRATEVIVSSNESYRTWARKIRTYDAFFASELYRERYNTNRGKLLTVTTNWTRLERLFEATEGVVKQQRYWFTTHRKLTEPQIMLRANRQRGESEYLALMPDVLVESHWFVTHHDRKVHALLEHVTKE